MNPSVTQTRMMGRKEYRGKKKKGRAHDPNHTTSDECDGHGHVCGCNRIGSSGIIDDVTADRRS